MSEASPADGEPAEGALLVELNALLGRGTEYHGNLSFRGRVRIEGRFEGDIRGEVLVIGEGAEVDGDIEVGMCVVTGGLVRAHIRARDAIELHAPSTVHGDLHAPNVFIDRGVQFEGACKMAPLEQTEEDADTRAERDVAEATSPLPPDGPPAEGLDPEDPDAPVLGGGQDVAEQQDPA